MDFSEQLRVLEAAQGDPAKLALATVDLAYPALPDGERFVLKQSLEAAAIPHWCDEAILAALLEIPKQESATRFTRLRGLSILEPFPARGGNAINVHEASRLALRKRMASDEEARFRTLSRRAAAHLEEDSAPAGRVEWIYHLLCGDPKRGATELESLDRNWGSCARPEDRYALASALRELEDTRLVQGGARVWVLLAIAWTRVSRGEAAQLADGPGKILDLARDAEDPRAEADSQCLLGDVLEAQGKLEAAQAAFEEYLAISRRLAEQNPSNAGWQLELAGAQSRIGGVLQAQGKLEAALAAFKEYLAISRHLAEQDPSNAGWQLELAGAQSRIGGVLQAQGKLETAQAAFGEALAISRHLAEQDPSNAGWKRELAVAQNRIGGVLQARGKLEAAQAAVGEALAISRHLAEQDPSNADWQLGLTVTQNRIGGVLQAQGKLEVAQAAFGEALAISRHLAEQDPSNADWQRELAVAQNRIGGVLQAEGKLEAAQAALGEALAISRHLAEQDPSNADWQRELAVACWRIAHLEAKAGRHAAALPLYEEASRIFGVLAERAPGFVQWAKEKENVESELFLSKQGKRKENPHPD